MTEPYEEQPSLYEKALAAAGGQPPVAPRPPRPSAAVTLWRRGGGDGSGPGLEVYWVRRSPSLPFMGGWYAFPGGGLARADAAVAASVPVAGLPRDCSPEERPPESFPESLLDGVDRLDPDLVPGLAVCAARELFEETGLLLAPGLMPGDGGDLAPALDRLGEARGRLDDGAQFGALLAELGVSLDLSRLVFAGRWLTPPFAPRRFDNRFFLLEWPADTPLQPRVIPGELAAGEWIAPARALARWQQGEVMTAPPILHLLRVLGEEGPENGLLRLRDPAEADLGPFRRIEFRPGVTMLPLATATLPPADRTNAYLLGTRERVLIDPGTPFEGELDRLRRALDALAGDGDGERSGDRVSAIWLTHHHPDHVGGVEAMRAHLGVPVLAHPETARRVAGRGIAVDGELTDGQRVVLEGADGEPFPIRVVHTPGHARGHLCFLEERLGSMVSGDLIAGVGTIVIDPPEGDMDQYLASLERVLELAPATLFPAHGPPVLDVAGKLRHYVEHRLWREEKVLTAWNDGLRDPAAMLPRVYDDAARQAWPLAARQIEAHLLRLRAAGRIGR